MSIYKIGELAQSSQGRCDIHDGDIPIPKIFQYRRRRSNGAEVREVIHDDFGNVKMIRTFSTLSENHTLALMG